MSQQQPNILVIMSDQHHAGVMGCAGDPIVQTPNLDRLADNGVRFTNSYCPSPLCGPSRMSFMTGCHPHEIGVWDNQDELKSDVSTFAHAFRSADYDTVLSGRMHFVGADQRHGFAERLIGDVSPTAYLQAGWQLEKVVGDLVDTCGMGLNGIVKSGPGHTGYQEYDEAVTAKTAGWLQKRGSKESEKPFLLTVGYVTPHCPFVSPPENFDYYKDKILLSDLPESDEHMHPRNVALRKGFGVDPAPPVNAQWRTRVAYYGLSTFLDRQVGTILDALEASGEADNTIVVYCSDHGESLGEHGLWWKSNFYDGSSRIPLIVSWPGHIKPGEVRTENVSLMDIGTTLMDLAGIDELPGVSGRSFQQLLNGDAAAWDDTVFAEYAVGTICRMVRSGPWKYNYYHEMEPELFNLDEDPNELHNLAGEPQHRDIEQHLHKLLLQDWDPDRVKKNTALAREETRLIADRIRSDNPSEPDPPWFDESPDNWVDDSITP
jgi:choline-sulfatase